MTTRALSVDTELPKRPSSGIWHRMVEKRLAYLESRLGEMELTKSTLAVERHEQIKRVVASRFGITVKAMESRCGITQVLYPRQIAMYVMYTEEFSYPSIARSFGKHHTTVMHSVDKIHVNRQIDQKLNETIVSLLGKLAEETELETATK